MNYLNEADTRAKLIDPAIHKRGWTEDLIRREETAGRIEIGANGKARRRRNPADYVLRVKVSMETQPVALALIEAKKSSLPPGHGLDQGKGYAECDRFNVKFVFSSNGYQFVEFDAFSGLTSSPRPMAEFPTPDELRQRYEAGMGFRLDSEAARPLLQPYPGGEGARRYYQDAAIRAVMEKIASTGNGGKGARALLSLATGAGKTFIAVNLLKRISDAGQMKRALFLCDRDELRTQAIGAFQRLFGSDAAIVGRAADGGNIAKNARVHIATYQTLGVEHDEGDATFLTTHYPENYFSHIVIDECHRSAWGKWSQVLTRNPDAVQIGLTATPRQLEVRETSEEARQDEAIIADNLQYFGEPVYSYDLNQAIEDGYLAACDIRRGRVNLDETGITKEEILARNPIDAITGRRVSEGEIEYLYQKTQYEDAILLPDRVLAMCKDLFRYLLETGGAEQKTIIFCARDHHADAVAAQMNNLYADWCRENGKERADYYAFKCTAASSGNDQLPDFRGASRSHFIATTVDLLSTGVDVPVVRNIVFFRYLNSPITFYQMVGRGTRIDLPTGKLMFRVYDYTNATRLFGGAFITALRGGRGAAQGDDEGEREAPPPETLPSVDGFEVVITDGGRFILGEVDGRATPIPYEEYKAQLAARLVAETPTLGDFRARWVAPGERQRLLDGLVRSGYSPRALQLVDERKEYDLYDVLAEVGWGMNPRTRQERALAFRYKQEDWINALPPETAAVVRAMASQFERGGTEGLESMQMFQTPEVKRAGGVEALRLAGEPRVIMNEMKQRMFAA